MCAYMCINFNVYNYYIQHTGYDWLAEFLICFEAWAKLAQQRLVCAPIGIHLEPINKHLMLLVTI